LELSKWLFEEFRVNYLKYRIAVNKLNPQ